MYDVWVGYPRSFIRSVRFSRSLAPVRPTVMAGEINKEEKRREADSDKWGYAVCFGTVITFVSTRSFMCPHLFQPVYECDTVIREPMESTEEGSGYLPWDIKFIGLRLAVLPLSYVSNLFLSYVVICYWNRWNFPTV